VTTLTAQTRDNTLGRARPCTYVYVCLRRQERKKRHPRTRAIKLEGVLRRVEVRRRKVRLRTLSKAEGNVCETAYNHGDPLEGTLTNQRLLEDRRICRWMHDCVVCYVLG